MKITNRKEEGIEILDLAGKLVIGDGDVALRHEIRDLLAQGAKKILLNLKGVRMMDSSGLGELMSVKDSVGAAGATIKLVHVEDKVQQVLEMARLIGLFETFNDEIDAIASFREG